MAGNFHPQTGDQVINATQRIEYVSSTKNYYGLAAPGTLTSALGWSIREEILDSQGRTISIKFAGGSAEYSKAWDNRATYDFS